MAETPISFVTVPSGRRPLSPPAKTDVLGGVEERLGQLANGLARQRGAELAEEQRVERVRIENEALSVMEAARLEARKAPRSSEVQRIYDEKTRPIADLLDQLPDEEKPLFQAFVARRGLAHMADLETTRSKMLARETQVVANEKLEGLKLAAANGTAADLQESLDQIGVFYAEQVGSGSIDEATAQEGVSAGRMQIQDAYMLGLNSRGLFDTALEAVGEMTDLPVARRAQFEASARAGRSERVYTDIGIALEQGADLSDTRKRVLQLRESRVLEEPQVRALLNEIEQRGKTGQTSERAAELAAIYTIYNKTGVLSESLSPKERNTIVNQSFAEFADRHPEKSRAELVADYAKSYNRIPESYFGQIVGEIESSNPEAVKAGVAELMHLDATTNGRLFLNTPDFARKSFNFQRSVQRRMFDGDLMGATSNLPGPVVPLEVAISRTQEVIGSAPEGTDPDELRQTYRTRIEQNQDMLLKALSQNREGLGGLASWALGSVTDVFDLEATQVPPGMMRAITAAAAENLSELRIDPALASEKDVAAAIDTAAQSLAKTTGMRVSTFNDNAALPEFLRGGELMAAAPEAVLPPVYDPENPESSNLGPAPYRATLAMSLGLDAARGLAGASPELAKVMENAIKTIGDDTSNVARSAVRGETQGLSDELLLRDPKPMDLVVDFLNRKRKQSGFDTPFASDYEATFDDVNAGLGLPKGLRWDPVIQPSRDTILAIQHNNASATGARVHVPWLIFARDRETGRDFPIFDRSSQVLGRRQRTISFDDPRDNYNPLTRDVNATNALVMQKRNERARLLQAASGTGPVDMTLQ